MEQLSKKNRNIILSIIFFIILLIILFLSWFYIFNVYEVKIIETQVSSLNYTVEIIPVNSLGIQAPFRNLQYSYKVEEGSESVEKIIDSGNGIINIYLNANPGKVKLRIETNKTQNFSLIEIPSNKTE